MKTHIYIDQIKAIKVSDSGLEGKSDEVYAEIAVGLGNDYQKLNKTDLGSFKINDSKSFAEKPITIDWTQDVFSKRKQCSIAFYDKDMLSTNDYLGELNIQFTDGKLKVEAGLHTEGQDNASSYILKGAEAEYHIQVRFE